MSVGLGKMYHPTNGAPIEIYRGFSWPCLFLGCFWYGFKGMWGWAVLAFAAALLTAGFSWLFFPFFANGQHVSSLKSKGYLTEEQRRGAKMPVTTQGASAPRDVAGELAKFAELRDKGVLTAEEFDEQKRRLLQGA
jgi:hypothetical protein